MNKRKLGKSGLAISAVGFGGIPIQGIDADAAAEVLNGALDEGIDFFDTARGYTDSEKKIGLAIADRRDEFIIATKSLARDADHMDREIETSLAAMRVEMIDLYQLHAVGDENTLDRVMGPNGAYAALDRARGEGKIRCIGITGHSRSILEKACNSGCFDTVQLPFNPIETEWADDVIPAARKQDMGIIGMKPVAGGALREIGAAFRFSLSHGVDVVIPGMRNMAEVKENAAIGRGALELTGSDREVIAREKELWSGSFCRRCGYCLPCSQGLAIPFLLLIEAYYTRYGGLQEWALERLAGLPKKYSDCTGCGDCLERCPYKLPIPEMMKDAAIRVK